MDGSALIPPRPRRWSNLVELIGAAYRDDLALVAFPTSHPQNLSGDRSLLKEADAVLAIDCRDVASLLDGYPGDKEDVGSGRERPGRKVIDMSLNDMAMSLMVLS